MAGRKYGRLVHDLKFSGLAGRHLPLGHHFLVCRAYEGFQVMTFAARTLGYGSAPFTPVQRTYTSGTSVTETAPVGATNVIIAVWGGGGGGQGGIGGAEPEPGQGGGAGGYSQSTYGISGNQTLVYTVGAGGSGGGFVAGGASGGNSTVSSGTKSITTMSGGGGGGGGDIEEGVGGVASGGTTTNTTGGSASGLSQGGTPVTGFDSNTGGAGGDGGPAVNGSVGSSGEAGKVIFYYT